MKRRPFKQVDVFTSVPYLGNPLAVVLDASDLTDAQIQHFAHWTHLSETTFVLPPTPAGLAAGADYRTRIFTPTGELPFAGHPTLGTSYAWLQSGGQTQQSGVVRQECALGVIAIRQEGSRLAFAAPALRRQTLSPALLAHLAHTVGLSPRAIVASQTLDNGPVFHTLLLESAQAVLDAQPNLGALKSLRACVALAAWHDPDQRTTMEVRTFGPHMGIDEDPITGSLNASLAEWLMDERLAPSRYQARQGRKLGRDGHVFVERTADRQIWVGGEVVTCIDGTVQL